ncbi:hypothetical protein ElyMa_000743600 [Elysia marginata]|uniref:Uncharacterized protein n=1 Tax=Elysia marginata TaxID=1093978 RepID=A0AAV4GP53_9GAST|nr:hypothetical protein ElyMa_000743600 [Elysia marginata]
MACGVRNSPGWNSRGKPVGNDLQFTPRLTAINRAVYPAAPYRLARSFRAGPNNGRYRSGQLCTAVDNSTSAEYLSRRYPFN